MIVMVMVMVMRDDEMAAAFCFPGVPLWFLSHMNKLTRKDSTQGILVEKACGY